jgi:glycosyltransferase involved in cell wall biosynthesis
MKILLTVHQFLPDHSTGTEILTYETAKELQKLGHTVSIFTSLPIPGELRDAERFDQYVYDDIPVERFYFNYKPMGDQSNPIEMEYNNHLVGTYFKDYLEREKPDIVHFFHLAHLSASPIDACHELGLPMVLTPTDFWFICPMFELRLPNNQLCAGPDDLGINCIRHMAAISQPRRINFVFQRIPSLLLRPLVFFIKKWRNIDEKYSPMVRALSERREILEKKINLIDKVIIPTQVMLSALAKNGLDKHRIISLPFGLNLTYLQNTSRPSSSKVLRLGYIGTLSEHKGLHVLMGAMANLTGKPVELKIYGRINEQSGYYKRVKAMAEADQRIEFCGTFPNPEIGAVFSEMDVLIVPSIWHENSPLVIYSAQYARCPVIGSNMAGISEVIEHGKNGLLFEAGNVDELASAIQTLINDREYLQQLSHNSRMPLSIQEYSAKLLAIYEDLLKEKELL